MDKNDEIDNFDLVVEGCYGFSSELSGIIDTMFTNVAFEQDENQRGRTQLRTEQEGAINAYLSDYIS